MTLFRNFVMNEEGAAAAEYAIVIAGVTGFIGVAVQYLFTNLAKEIEHVGHAVSGLVGSEATPAGLLGGIAKNTPKFFTPPAP